MTHAGAEVRADDGRPRSVVEAGGLVLRRWWLWCGRGRCGIRGKPILEEFLDHGAERTALHGTACLGAAVEVIGNFKGGFHVLQLAGLQGGVNAEFGRGLCPII